MMKACRWVEKDVKFVKQICSWRQVLLGDSGTFFPLMYANAQLSTFTGAHYGLVFFSAVCCLSNFTLFFGEGGDKVINCLLGNGLTHVERLLHDPAGSVLHQCTLHFSSLIYICLLWHWWLWRKQTEKSVHIVLARHSDLKGGMFWEDKLLTWLLGHRLKCRYVLFLWDLIQGFDQKHRDRGQHKHHPRDCSLRARDPPTFL